MLGITLVISPHVPKETSLEIRKMLKQWSLPIFVMSTLNLNISSIRKLRVILLLRYYDVRLRLSRTQILREAPESKNKRSSS